MGNNLIKLNESQLRDIVAKSVMKVLNEEKDRFSVYGWKGDGSERANNFISYNTDKDWGKREAVNIYNAVEHVKEASKLLPSTNYPLDNPNDEEEAWYRKKETVRGRGFYKTDTRIRKAWEMLLKVEKLLSAAAQDLAGGYDEDKRNGRFDKPDYNNNGYDDRGGFYNDVFQDEIWAKQERDGI